MGDINLNGGIITAAGAVIPGVGASYPIAVPKTSERLGTPGATVSTLTMTLNTEYATPIYVPAAMTLPEISVKVSTGVATALVRLGIRSDDATGNLQPGAVLLDAGTVDASTTGIKPIVISLAIASAGLYWLTATAQTAAPGVTSIAGGFIQLASGASDPFTGAVTGYTQTGVTGALGTWSGTRSPATTCPRVFVQKQ